MKVDGLWQISHLYEHLTNSSKINLSFNVLYLFKIWGNVLEKRISAGVLIEDVRYKIVFLSKPVSRVNVKVKRNIGSFWLRSSLGRILRFLLVLQTKYSSNNNNLLWACVCSCLVFSQKYVQSLGLYYSQLFPTKSMDAEIINKKPTFTTSLFAI